MNIQTAAFIAGIVFGSIAVASASYVWYRHQVFGVGGSMLSVAGIALLGLSIWSGIEIEFSREGLRAEFQRLERQLGTVAAVTREVTEEVRNIAESAEIGRRQLIELTNALEAQRAIAPAELEEVRKAERAAPAVDVQRLERAGDVLQEIK